MYCAPAGEGSLAWGSPGSGHQTEPARRNGKTIRGYAYRPLITATFAIFVIAVLGLLPEVASAQGIITTVAGGGPPDGTPALSAGIPRPTGVAKDNLGNLYFSSNDTGQVYKVDASGLTQLVASVGSASALAVDALGNLFVAEPSSMRVARIDGATAAVTTIAGNGFGFSGDGGLATNATLNGPWGVAVDGAGNVFIADVNNQRIRRIDAATGIITTVAGTGTAGFNGDGIAATSAQLNYPIGGVAVDYAGNFRTPDMGVGIYATPGA